MNEIDIFKTKLIEFSPFILETTNDEFYFNENVVIINNGIPILYDIINTNLGLEIKIEKTPMNFFNLIVVFGQNQIDKQVINFNYDKLKISFNSRSQFIGLISTKCI